MDKLQEYVAEDLPMGNILEVEFIQRRTNNGYLLFYLSIFNNLFFSNVI